MVVNPDAGVTLHRQIYQEWRNGILTGRFRRGDRVPSSRELAATLGVSRSTVTEAYDQLVAEGYLESVHGSGTYVCRHIPDELSGARRAPANGLATGVSIRISRYGERLRDDLRSTPVGPGVIRFSSGRPDLEQFPFRLWRKLLARHLRQARPEMFDYAEESAGYEPLRREVAASLARSRAVRCTFEQVIIVNGSQQSLDLCARLLLEPGEVVAMEDPGYPGAQRVFRAYGTKIRPVRVDQEGIVVRDLGHRARLVYITPSHQFPTGVSMSLARRLELIEWAQRSGALLIEDDYASEYRYSGPPLPALQSLARDVPVIYVGTFSKIMFPGLRIGYAVVPAQLAQQFIRAKWMSDRQTPVLEQAALADFIREGHLERHIRRMRRLYGRRREALVDALARHFGDRAKIAGDAAGMHVLVRFDDPEVVRRVGKNRIQAINAGLFYLHNPAKNELVLGFAGLGERSIREGIRRLAS
ncbi:MAG TPA: PLP-dependent aminotransferase family protein [Bryobacteraceae bacterium]|nr:PLP-dependent aminotransferase family protein [Bryobacteraceae bacterium]